MKKIFIGLFSAILLLIATLNINVVIKPHKASIDITLSNIEALGEYEYGNDACITYCIVDHRYVCHAYVPAPLGGYTSFRCIGFRS